MSDVYSTITNLSEAAGFIRESLGAAISGHAERWIVCGWIVGLLKLDASDVWDESPEFREVMRLAEYGEIANSTADDIWDELVAAADRLSASVAGAGD